MRSSIRFAVAIATCSTVAACHKEEAPPPPAAVAAPIDARLAVGGGSIWYHVAGNGIAGTPVIILHGDPKLSSSYLTTFDSLADERPIVRYDRLGSGKSDSIHANQPIGMDILVAQLDSLRAHLAYRTIHLIGHLSGANLAMAYYRAHPERVSSLTLESASLDHPAFGEKRYDVAALLPTVHVPVLFILGDFDTSDSATVRRFARLTHGSLLVQLRAAAHAMPSDASMDNVRIVRAFLSGVDRDATNPSRP